MTKQDAILARYDIPSKNDDFDARVVVDSALQPWIDTDIKDVRIKLLEAVPSDNPRLTMLIRFAPGGSYDLRQHHGGEEFLVLEGSLNDERGIYDTGCYVRNPVGTRHILTSASGCTLFAKMGEFGTQDQAQRQIETGSESLWLPGPVEGTSVLPLHMHDTRSVLLIRWDTTTSFKPGLDPQGEEIFVMSGSLNDPDGDYPDWHWIRNPIEQWQPWQGSEGTLVYYKNGHFPSTITEGKN